MVEHPGNSLHVIIRGRVQGVGFRDFARRSAQSRGLAGYVRNLPNGDVEVYAEGGQEDLEHLRSRLRQGPGFALVREMEESWGAATGGHKTFEIRF